MKEIILVRRSGTRGISKELVPIYDKSMIYYPLSVCIISTPHDLVRLKSY